VRWTVNSSMKLRMQGDSLRLRIGPSEVERLMAVGRVEETIHFASDDRLTWALEHSKAASCLSVRRTSTEVAVILPTAVAQAWAGSEDVGIYGEVSNGLGALQLAIEKDFACLDPVHSGNLDTYPNPKAAC
jgi:hypothetical protein